MNVRIYKTAFLILGAMIINSCSKQDIDPLQDNRPTVPVSITNATEFRPDPTVTTSLAAGGNISVVLSIPASSGRTIKEITRIAAATSYTKIQSGGSTGYYENAPIAVNGTTYTYNTTVSDYFVKFPATSATGSNPPAAANKELALRFYFLVTLDDNSQVVTMPVRILVLT
ncbi:MAG TPA: hypothetical protein VGE79_10830 [Niastella sp.]